MKNKVTFMLMALGVALPVVSLQAQDSQDRPARQGGGPRGDRPIPGVFGALDANHDRTLDKSEISGATEALKKLDKDSDGKLTGPELRGGPAGSPGPGRGARPEGDGAERPRGPRNDTEDRAGQRRGQGGEGGAGGGGMMAGGPLVAAIDANSDRTIDADEIKGAPAALLKLDKNSDGQLTIEELAPARGNRAGQDGERPNRERRGQRGNQEEKKAE